jgi:LysR family hydrogen peroxide-inducible transcriptional activator
LSVSEDAMQASQGKPRKGARTYVKYIPFAPGDVPYRRVVLVWRRSFTRYEAIAALRNAVYACPLPGVNRLS